MLPTLSISRNYFSAHCCH